jgi:hypothetical protein
LPIHGAQQRVRKIHRAAIELGVHLVGVITGFVIVGVVFDAQIQKRNALGVKWCVV